MSAFRAWVDTLPPLPGEVRLVSGPVPEIVLDHPATKNALHPRMMVQLADAFAAARGAPVVILRGEGHEFCTGGDLGAVETHLAHAERADEFSAFMTETIDTLSRSDSVLVGAVSGHALGGGAELVASCDLVFAHPDVKIGFVHARLGVSPGFGGGARLVRRIGPRAALRTLVEARMLRGAEAHAIGLVDEVTPDPLAAARAWAAEVDALPAEAVRGAVRLCRDPSNERAVFASLWGGPAHKAALAARRKRR